MAQFQCPADFVPLQQVTAANLNAHVNNATALPGLINDQSTLSGSVESADSVLIYDNSTTSLKKTSAGNILSANIPVVTSSITAGNGSDLAVNINDGTAVTGSTYISADGITVVVTTPAAHGFSPGQIVVITAAASGYNGKFILTAASGSSFTYVLTTAATAGSGTLTYARNGTSTVTGNQVVTRDSYVGQNLNVIGDLTVSGNVSGNINTSGNFTNSGTANFTGTLQVNGSVGYVLTEIYEETIPPWSAPSNGQFWGVFTSASFTKPAGEIWAFEVTFNWRGYFGYGGGEWAGRYGSVAQGTGAYHFHDFYFDSQGGGTFYRQQVLYRWTADSATTFTSETFKIDASNSSVGLQLFATVSTGHSLSTSVTPSKFRIYKYKTA
jgi:hypothetical protein